MSLHSAAHANRQSGYAEACRRDSSGAAEHASHEELAIAAVLDDAHQAIAARMACRHLRFHVVNKAGAACIAGCRASLVGALVSLLENALAACLQGDYVELSATADEDEIRLAVRDTGCGIPRELQAHLFDTSFAGGGKGLGLALVRSVAEAHGGAVAASSAPGRGSEFALYLPRRQQTQA